MNKILGILSIAIGIDILLEPKFSFRGTVIDYSSPFLYIPIVGFFLIVGVRILYYEYYEKK
jgi:hypothetical protein